MPGSMYFRLGGYGVPTSSLKNNFDENRPGMGRMFIEIS